MSKPPDGNFRSRFYDSYVDTHMGHVRDISLAAIAAEASAFRHYYGQLLPTDKLARIVEVGCGYGAFIYYLKCEKYQNVVGVDISPQQVETAEQLGLANVICGDTVSYLNSKPDVHDCIVAIDMIDHIPKDEVLPTVESIKNSLKPGGRFIMQVVNGAGPFSGRLRYGDFTHEFALTSTSAGQVLRTAGFEGIKIYGAGPHVHGVKSFIRWLVWHAVTVLMWTYMVAETGDLGGHIFTQNLIVTAHTPISIADSETKNS